MGLKITTQLHTNKGQTSEMYLNIEKISINKNNNHNVIINKYLNQEDRETNHNNKCQCFEVTNMFIFNYTPEQLKQNYLFEIVYESLKNKLQELGLTIENVIE